MNKLSIERLSDFERDPSNNFLTRSEMMEAIKELIALREAMKVENVPFGYVEHQAAVKVVKGETRFAALTMEPRGDKFLPLFTAQQKPGISKEKLCDWLEDNFDIDDSQRDAFANCFAHHCNCIVKDGD